MSPGIEQTKGQERRPLFARKRRSEARTGAFRGQPGVFRRTRKQSPLVRALRGVDRDALAPHPGARLRFPRPPRARPVGAHVHGTPASAPAGSRLVWGPPTRTTTRSAPSTDGVVVTVFRTTTGNAMSVAALRQPTMTTSAGTGGKAGARRALRLALRAQRGADPRHDDAQIDEAGGNDGQHDAGVAIGHEVPPGFFDRSARPGEWELRIERRTENGEG